MQMTRLIRSILMLVLLIVSSEWGTRAQDRIQETPSNTAQTSSAIENPVEILTPTGGVDFSQYIGKMMPAIRRNWYAAMPEAALAGEKGKAIVRFQIQADGKVDNILLELSSGKESFDHAALKGIRDSNPVAPFRQPLRARTFSCA
jgi:TonB family protein